MFFLGFCQWLSRADRVVILTQPSDLHCFGELELGPWPALAYMRGPGTWAESRAIVEGQS